MAYGVINPVAVMATQVDSLNRSCVSATDVEQGGPVNLLALSTTAGESEVWTASIPATNYLDQVWMAYDPELVWTGSYRGLNPDVRDYIITATRIFSAFRLEENDLILMSADAFSAAKSTDTFANTTNGGAQFVWGSTQSNDCVALKYRATKYFSIGTGAMDNQRFTAYLMEVLPVVYT